MIASLASLASLPVDSRRAGVVRRRVQLARVSAEPEGNVPALVTETLCLKSQTNTMYAIMLGGLGLAAFGLTVPALAVFAGGAWYGLSDRCSSSDATKI